MRKSLFSCVLSISAASLIASCGGGGGGGTTTSTLQGQFVDAPVAGLEYSTSSGITGVTDADGYFSYREGDTVTFKIGKMILGDAKGNDKVTPTVLYVDEITDPNLLQQKVNTVVALLLALDSDPNDNKITIPETVIQEFENLTAEKNLEEDDDLTGINVDIDNDGQEENLAIEVENKKNEAEDHYEGTLYDLLIYALNKFNGKDFYFSNDNPPVRCTLQYNGGDKFSFSCPEDPEKNDTATILQNPLRLVSLDGIEHYVISADDDEICVYWVENQTMKTTCLKLWEDDENYNENETDYSYFYTIDLTSFETFLQGANGKRILTTASDYDEQNQYYQQEVKSCEINVDFTNKQINFTNCYGDDPNEVGSYSLTYWEGDDGRIYVRGIDEPSTVQNPVFILKDSKIACIKELSQDNYYNLACMFNIDNPIYKQPNQDIINAIVGLWKRYKVNDSYNAFSELVGDGACIRFNSDGTLDYITQNSTEQLTYQIKSSDMVDYGTISAVTVSTTNEDIILFPLYKDTSGNMMTLNIWLNKDGSLSDADVRLFKPVDTCF